MTNEPSNKSNGKSISFEVDGERHRSKGTQRTAAEILGIVGLDPAEYDLLQILGPEVEHRFHDDDVIDLDRCDSFVSLFTGATPVA